MASHFLVQDPSPPHTSLYSKQKSGKMLPVWRKAANFLCCLCSLTSQGVPGVISTPPCVLHARGRALTDPGLGSLSKLTFPGKYSSTRTCKGTQSCVAAGWKIEVLLKGRSWMFNHSLLSLEHISSCAAPAEQSSVIRLFLSAPPFPLLPLLRDTDSSTLACEVRDVDWNLWKRKELKAYFHVSVPALQMSAGRWLWLYLGLRKKGGGGEIAVFNLAIHRTH